MPDLLDLIGKYREAILLGEFGALIHMFGKASSDFLKFNSDEGGVKDPHQDIKNLPTLAAKLQNSGLGDRFAFTVDGAPSKLAGDFTDFVTKYKGDAPDSHLIKLFNTCHRMTSADEKGVVRHKQSIHSMRITTPFGRVVQAVSPSEIDNLRENMDRKVAEVVDNFLRGSTIEKFRGHVIEILEADLSAALGETREPANDVTLWAQSHGVASLYKPCLATLALGKDPCPRKKTEWDYDDVRWRLLGIGWNGLGFVQRGRRAADILRRQEILAGLRDTLRTLFEVEYPLGNLFYHDLNGAFFTFPGIEDEPACDLVKEVAPQVVGKVRTLSDDELWPFFTLSTPRRTLTTISREIMERNRLAASPCIAAILSVEGEGSRQELLVEKGPLLAAPHSNEDICPVCRFRSKAVTADTCKICADRRRGRQDAWIKNLQGQTIWVDEIADANGRIALLTLRFDLGRWLSGEWLTTVFSQTFSKWVKGRRLQSSAKRLKEFVDKRQIELPDGAPVEAGHSLAAWIVQNRNRTECKPALEAYLEDGEISSVPRTFNEIEDLYGIVTDNTLLSHFFTQNPSPGRLTRIWGATQDFLASLSSILGEQVFKSQPERLDIRTKDSVQGVERWETYRIEVSGLNGGSVATLCIDNAHFLTIDCLERFTLIEGGRFLRGTSAVREALRDRGIKSWYREASGAAVGNQTSVKQVAIAGSYLPFTVLAETPVFYQALLPASSVPDILRPLLELEEAHFGQVRGKLPLHVGLLVAKRRFPLYALVEAGQQILDHSAFKNGWLQNPWWTSGETDPFYGYYPTQGAGERGFSIAALSPIETGGQFWMTPGFFDFDFLEATTDRHRLRYEAASPPTRPAIRHGWLRRRPMALQQLKQLTDVWKLLAGLTATQRHQIEAALGAKLEQWRGLGEEACRAFHTFAKAVLQDAYGKTWSENLGQEQREQLLSAADDGLLMEAMQLFHHVLKGDAGNE